ncbi:sulfotransferase ssu-1-like [Oppia nitens]|uniref:sulfotransferase ssu-1-like n=1 Tax=Oppia nitens TaxID=1686743 RepID=UPI0023DA907F|nr:sulfotransferase ssu-1-like [Oppia nitens]
MEITDIYDNIFKKDVSRIFPANYLSQANKLEHRPNHRFLISYNRCGSNWFIYIVQLILSSAENTDPVDDENYIIESVGLRALDMTRKMMSKTTSNSSSNVNTNGAIVNDTMTVDNDDEEDIVFLKTDYTCDNFPLNSMARYMLLMRNPKDVYHAFYQAIDNLIRSEHRGLKIGEIKQYDKLLDYWLSDSIPDCYNYFTYVKQYWLRYRREPNFQFILYEDMKLEPRKAIETIAMFLGDNYVRRLSRVMDSGTGETLLDRIERLSTMDTMKPMFDKQDSWRLRKGLIGNWRSHLTREQSDAIDRKAADKWTGTGLELLWERELKWE